MITNRQQAHKHAERIQMSWGGGGGQGVDGVGGERDGDGRRRPGMPRWGADDGGGGGGPIGARRPISSRLPDDPELERTSEAALAVRQHICLPSGRRFQKRRPTPASQKFDGCF